MASKLSHAKQGAETAAHQSSHPGDQALLPKQRHKLLQVREKGHLAVQRRPDLGPWRSPQPQHWAKELRSGWPEAPHQRARDLDRLHIAHLLGVGGGWSIEPRPDLQAPARRGATGRPRAREKQRAAVRGEKRRQEDLVRLRPCPLKSRRTAEKKGAGKAVGLPHPDPGPPEKNKGKRRSSRKTGGGRRPDPRVRGDLDMGTLWASAGGVVLLGDRERDGAPGRRRSPARAARLAPGPKNDCPGQHPQGQEDNPEPPWPVGGPCGRGASPPVSPPQLREGSKWKRELESVFRELFSTNRKLKTYLESRPATDMCPSEELGFPEPCGCQGEPCWERRAGDLLMELAPGPAQADARPVAPSTNLKELLCQLKDRQYRRLVEPLLPDEGDLPSHPEEESPLWCGLRPRHDSSRPDMLLSQLRPPAEVGRARSEPAWPKQSREQRWRPQLVEVLELPQLSWEALGRPPMEPGEEMTETETETGPQMSAHPAHVPGPPSPDLEEARGCERSTAAPPATSPPAASSEEEEEEEEEEEDNDSKHSQMIRDLEEQILEQSKSHKQFLEQARRRLQEFQSVC